MDKLYKASFTFIGTIIGAGVLGLPRVISKSGFLTGLIDILLIGILMLIISLMFGEITLRTKEAHQLPGLVGKYIGKKLEHLVAFFSITSMYGALAAYIVGNGTLISKFFGLNLLFSELLFFIPFSIIIYFGIKGVAESETPLTLIIIFCILVLSLASFFYFDAKNLLKINLASFFSPIGVIIFALSGMFAIPQMKEILWLERNKLKKSILIGFLTPLLLYILFVFATIAALGSNLSEIVTISLSKYGTFFLIFGNIFAFFAMTTCFISLGNALKEIYWQDYKLNKNLAFFLAISPPMIAFLNLASFIEILSITGSLFMIPLLIITTYLYAKTKRIGERKPEYELKIPKVALWLIIIFLFVLMILIIWQTLGDFI